MVTVHPLADVEAALTRRGPSRMVPGLERIEALLDALGNPQRAYPTIHVAGTNGKTSTSRMIESLLRAHGLRTGRNTSPHLDSVAERIALDGEPISPQELVAVYRDVAPYVDLIDALGASSGNSSAGSPGDTVTYFEFVTALAFAAFAEAPVDAAVIEVGLGGRLDATNVIDSAVAVITPIDLDHQGILGDTIAEIAAEKAGIIAASSVVVCAAQALEALKPLLTRAVTVDASVAREGVEFGVRDRALAVGGQELTLQGLSGTYSEIFLPLYGAHQAQNAAVALAAVEAFFGAGSAKPLDSEVVREAFAQVSSPGRLELVRSSPAIIVDAAHNPHGLRATLVAVAESFRFRRLIAVFSPLIDKNVRGMLELLEPAVEQIVVTQNSSPRVMNVDELAAAAVKIFGPDRVDASPRLDDAISCAVRIAEEEEFAGGGAPLAGAGILVTGSVVTAGDARRLLR